MRGEWENVLGGTGLLGVDVKDFTGSKIERTEHVDRIGEEKFAMRADKDANKFSF